MRIPEVSVDKTETRLDLGYVAIWYSYRTMVAFQYEGGELCVSRNYWSNTTGKLINRLSPNKKDHLDSADFQAAWENGTPDPLKNLALAALNGDGIALDAIRDVVKV